MLSKFFKNPINSTAIHPIFFALDFRASTGKQDSLQNYVKRETDYDIAFCSAWQFAFNDALGKRKFDNIENKTGFLIGLLENIHDQSLQHLPKVREVIVGNQKGYQRIHGRATEWNYYGLVKDWTANQAGLQEFIEAILDGKKKGFNELNIRLEETDQRLILKENGLYVLLEGDRLQKLDLSRENIIKKILDEFNKGPCKDGSDRIIVYILKHHQQRLHREHEILTAFLEKMEHAETNEAKTKTIALMIRDLMQMHLYWDGNGRALFIFANWLMDLYDLSPFYPTNMCIFDANSIDKMYSEIIQGQQRFVAAFGSKEELTSGLKAYSRCISELKNLITNGQYSPADLKTLNATFASRDLNLLFRQMATNSNKLPILEYMLVNQDQLNIDIHEKGKTSGKDAFDIAKEKNNEPAIDLLSEDWPDQQANIQSVLFSGS